MGSPVLPPSTLMSETSQTSSMSLTGSNPDSSTWDSWEPSLPPFLDPLPGNWLPEASLLLSFPTLLSMSSFSSPSSLRPQESAPPPGSLPFSSARPVDSSSMKFTSEPLKNVPPRDTPMIPMHKSLAWEPTFLRTPLEDKPSPRNSWIWSNRTSPTNARRSWPTLPNSANKSPPPPVTRKRLSSKKPSSAKLLASRASTSSKRLQCVTLRPPSVTKKPKSSLTKSFKFASDFIANQSNRYMFRTI